MVRPFGYVPRSNSHRTRRPVAVRVAQIRFTITARLTSGCPRQLRLMYENSRCSIVFHLLVPGGKWQVVMVRPVRLASCCSSMRLSARHPLNLEDDITAQQKGPVAHRPLDEPAPNPDPVPR